MYGQPFGQGTGPIHMEGVECQGNESSILQCNHSGLGTHDCDHSRDVSVNCTSYRSMYYIMNYIYKVYVQIVRMLKLIPAEFDIIENHFVGITTRLVGGSNPYEGRLEVYRNGFWGTVSDFWWVWNNANTAVVCRSLGYLWYVLIYYPFKMY